MSKKTFRGLLALILVVIFGFAIFITCGVGSSVNGVWFKNGNFSTWFNGWGQSKTEKQEEIEFTGKGMLVLSSPVGNNGISLISEQSSVDSMTSTVTAVIEPENADYRSVKWSCSDSVIVVTPNEDNPLTATVTAVGVLKKTATITVTVSSLTELSASISVDMVEVNPFLPKYRYFSLLNSYSLKFGEENIFRGRYDYLKDYDPSSTVCTVNGEVYYNRVFLQLKDETIGLISQALGLSVDDITWYKGYGVQKWNDYTYETVDDDGSDVGYVSYKFNAPATPYEMFVNEEEATFTADEFRAAFFKVCDGKNNVGAYYYAVSYCFNDVTVATYNSVCDFGFDSSSYMLAVEYLSIDGDGVVLHP